MKDINDLPDDAFTFVTIACDCMHITQTREGVDTVAVPCGKGTGIEDGVCTNCCAEIKVHACTMPRPLALPDGPKLGRALKPLNVEWVEIKPLTLSSFLSAIGIQL